MKAVLVSAYGGPEVLTLQDVDRPTPEASQVLVEVHAAATNPSYCHRMEGKVSMLRQAHGYPEPTEAAMGGDCARTLMEAADASMRSRLPWRVSRQARSSAKPLIIVEGA